MSLYIPTDDGLLGTHVTWHDVESAMQTCLQTNARFGDGKKVTNIGEMKGFLSRIALVEPDWRDEKGSNIASESHRLPEKLVVKIASQLALVEFARLTGNRALEEVKVPAMEPVTRMFHDKEVKVYEMLEREGNPRIPYPKVYCSKSFNREDPSDLKAFLVFEYIPHRHLPMSQCISARDLLPVIRAIASFSAIGEKLPESELEFVGNVSFWEEILNELKDQQSLQKACQKMKEIFPAEIHGKCDRMLEIYQKSYIDMTFVKKLTKVSEFLGHKPVLSHCDLWNSNLLFGDTDTILKAIIDFQTVSWCSPGLDLSRLFACVLNKTERREKTEELLELYYKTFLEELNGTTAPFSFQQLLDSYSIFFPVMGMMIVPGILQMTAHEGGEQDVDKIVGLIEDVIETHERNRQKFPEFYVLK